MSMIETDIRVLLTAPDAGEGAPSLAAIEHMLTTGYAGAMALEAEQRRLRRRLTELSLGAATGAVAADASELRAHAARLRASERELMRLRDLIGALRARAAQTRAA